MFKEF
jgi:hypothetical protein